MFLSLLEKRRSIRKYTDQDIDSELLAQIVEAALRAPSGRAIDPWEFVVVTDRSLLEKLSESRPAGAGQLKNAAAAIVVCADKEKTDIYVEDSTIASIIIHLAATSLGLGSCWIQVRNRQHEDGRPAEEFIKELLGIPSGCFVQSIISMGHPAESKDGHKKEDLKFDKVFKNSYGEKMF